MKKYFYRIAAFILPAYWFLVRPHTRGVKVLIECDNEYIFIRHTYGNSTIWTLPGGGVRRGEQDKDAVVREVNEELGISVPAKNLKYLGSYTSTKEYKHDHVKCFKMTIETKPEILRDHGEIAEWKWFSKNSLPEKISTAAKMALEMYGV
jgi:8-oxo-dGTP pyrophosphatase MutT (NUDIX family)